MTYFLARQFLGEKLALFTALCTAISPHMISATSYMLTETLFGFLMTTSFFFITIAIKKKTHSLFLSAGILLALASLTRPTIQYFIVPLTIGLFFASNRLSLNKNLLGSLLLGFFIIYTPWIARNLHVLGTTSDSTLTINTLHHGIYPDFMYQSNPQTRGIPYRHDPRSAEISTSVNSVLKEIQRRFENEPLQHLKWYLLDKPITFFSWNIIAGYGDVFIYPITRSPYLNNPTFQSLHQIMYWLHWPLVILSLFGSCAAWLPNRMLGMSKNGLFALRGLSLLVLYFITVHIIGAPFPRYSIPLRPITYILASCSINVLIRLAITKRISS
jgi:4-amino-4-deoxy-L-arabinose transferase-like glycosyltransferase